MCYEDIAIRIHEKSKRIGLSFDYIAAQLNLSGDTVRKLATKRKGMLYTFLDVIAELNLELRLDDQVIYCHQDTLNYIKKFNIDIFSVSVSTSVPVSEIKRLLIGENISVQRFFTIVHAIGIEAKVI